MKTKTILTNPILQEKDTSLRLDGMEAFGEKFSVDVVSRLRVFPKAPIATSN
jgi:hypothetical protein